MLACFTFEQRRRGALQNEDSVLIGGIVKRAVRSMHWVAKPSQLPERIALLFHDLGEENWPAFRSCIQHYRALGYEIVPIDVYVDAHAKGKQLFISFDDNLHDWFRALPLFDELGVRATFYLNTQPIREWASRSEIERFLARIAYDTSLKTLSAHEIRVLHGAGHTIGCHTHSHVNLAQLGQAGWDEEILGCKRLLEDIIGAPVDHFSYPFGMRRFFSEPLRAYCIAGGLKTIAAGVPGRLYEPGVCAFDLQRTRWQFSNSHRQNVEDVAIDGRLFETLTGRSAVG